MPRQNIIITKTRELQQTIAAMATDGPDKLHIISDFDRTLTKAFVNGRSVPSLLSILRDYNYLTPDYPAKAQALFKKYHSLETDPKMSLAEKKKAMHAWWSRHFALLIKSGLNKKDIARAMQSGQVRLRTGAKKLFRLLEKNHIPLVIMSSSGLGYESISYFLKHEKLLTKNVYIISNSYHWDNQGRAISIKRPIIHSLNKKEVLVKNFPFFKKIRNRTNVILLGDVPADRDMVTGFHYDNMVSVGFLNNKVTRNLADYKKIFNVIITNDGTLDYVSRLLEAILYSK